MVEHLPPMDWTDLATKRDLADTTAELRGEIALLRSEMTAGFALIDERFKSVDTRFTSIDERFASIEARLDQHEKVFATKADVLALSVQLEQGLRRMTLTLLYGALGLVGAVTSVVGVLVGT